MSEHYDEDQEIIQTCSSPPRPPREFAPGVSPTRRAAILSNEWKWLNGTNIKYYFTAGKEAEREVVRRGFDIWREIGIGLRFSEVERAAESDIRIGWSDTGSWSLLGKNCRNFPNEVTMNFGWDITVNGPNGLDTVVHEIGHALGLEHEHQNSRSGIEWNREACYRYFRRTQNPPWTRAKTDFNILDPVDLDAVQGSSWDPNSIMHYAFARGLIVEPARFRAGLTPEPGLSPKDKEVVRQFYPDEAGTDLPLLSANQPAELNIRPSEQKNFRVVPEETRWYTFLTFGRSDTVMVLFEEENGELELVAGDDDSGEDTNARIEVRLRRGRRYQLRTRLYFSADSGATQVMMS